MMDADRLAEVLRLHELWLAGGGDEGQRADLSRQNLAGADLSGRDLSHAKLVATDLRGSSLAGTVLRCADLQEADLRRAKLDGAVLKDASLANSNLEEADLSTARFLKEGQLGGCNAAHATLPASFTFQGLELADEAARNLGVQLLSTLMVCLYSWLTLGSTSDLDLLTNASTVSFPFIDISLPIVGLYLVAPVVVFTFFVSLYLHMTIFWGRLATLPAYFPNGEDLCEKIYPTLLNSYINRDVLWLARKKEYRLADTLNILLIRFGLDGLVLLTLALYWLRYLPRHDVWGTALHLVLLCVAMVASWGFHTVLRNRLRRASAIAELRTKLGTLSVLSLLISAAVTLSVLAFSGARLPWNMLYADLEQQSLSDTSELQDGREGQLAFTRGAELRDRNLRFINLDQAFAVNSSFARSDLFSADLSSADLRGANFSQADLSRAQLQRGRFHQARFYGSVLRDAKLTHAELTDVIFSRADLRRADLSNARLDRSTFSRADLSGAILQGVLGQEVDFSLAKLDSVRLGHARLEKANLFLAEMRQARLWKARLSGSSLVLADLRQADLSHADLSGADLAQANLRGARLRNTDFRSARLTFARLNEVSLGGSCLLDADLSGAQLGGADLRGAALSGANFEGTWLAGAHLQDADLSAVRGLHDHQLIEACLDPTTRLPPALEANKASLLAASEKFHAGSGVCQPHDNHDNHDNPGETSAHSVDTARFCTAPPPTGANAASS